MNNSTKKRTPRMSFTLTPEVVKQLEKVKKSIGIKTDTGILTFLLKAASDNPKLFLESGNPIKEDLMSQSKILLEQVKQQEKAREDRLANIEKSINGLVYYLMAKFGEVEEKEEEKLGGDF